MLIAKVRILTATHFRNLTSETCLFPNPFSLFRLCCFGKYISLPVSGPWERWLNFLLQKEGTHLDSSKPIQKHIPEQIIRILS